MLGRRARKPQAYKSVRIGLAMAGERQLEVKYSIV